MAMVAWGSGGTKEFISETTVRRVQTVLKTTRQTAQKANDPKPLCGLVIARCGMMFTAETGSIGRRQEDAGT